MKALLAMCLIVTASFAWAGEPGAAAQGGGSIQGKVLEVKSVDNFTYLRLMTNNGEMWAAVVNAKAKKGETVTITQAMMMENFKSKALNRTFKQIIFGSLGGAGGAAPAAPAAPAQTAPLSMYSSKPKLEKINDTPVDKASGANAKTIAEVVTQAAALKGKQVTVRGKVVKYNAEIMGVNWLHLRDGSGTESDGSNDILVTTSAAAKVGDVLTVQGTVETDKDFGSGYAYKVLIEKASVQK